MWQHYPLITPKEDSQENCLTVGSWVWVRFTAMRDRPRSNPVPTLFLASQLRCEFSHMWEWASKCEKSPANVFPKNPLCLMTWIKMIMEFSWTFAEAGLQSHFKLGADNLKPWSQPTLHCPPTSTALQSAEAHALPVHCQTCSFHKDGKLRISLNRHQLKADHI